MKTGAVAMLAIGLALLAVPAFAQRGGGRPGPGGDRPTGGGRPGAGPDRPGPDHSGTPVVAPPPVKTASESYWDSVRAASGPIGYPQPASNDKFTGPSRPRPPYGSGFYGGVTTYVEPEPVYVPVYVPGPVVYVPAPAAEAPAPPAEEHPSVPPAPRHPEKFYVITGCYAGNKPPKPAALPAGCDIQKMRVSTW